MEWEFWSFNGISNGVFGEKLEEGISLDLGSSFPGVKVCGTIRESMGLRYLWMACKGRSSKVARDVLEVM